MLISVFLTLFVFGTYLHGVSPSVYGGDSGDVILSAWFAGIAHAPGYPLNALIGWIFTHLPYNATVAFKADVMAAFFQALVVLLSYLIVKKITKNLLVAVFAALTLGFTYVFWLYAHIIEVFQLNVLLVAISVFFLMSWRERELLKKPKISLFYLAILFLGLAIFHHLTSVLVLPAFLYLVFKTKRDIFKKKIILLKSFLVLFVGILPYLYFPIASLREVPTNWRDASTFAQLFKLITRSDYGTFVASGTLLGSDVVSRLTEIASYVFFIKADFKVMGLIFIVLGIIYLFKKDRILFWFITVSVFFTGPFFLFYSSFPISNDFYRGLWERFLLLSYFFITFFLAFGYLAFFKFVQTLFNRFSFLSKSKRNGFALLFSILIFVLPLNLISTNNFKVNLSSFHLGDWVGSDILNSADDNAVIFLLGDVQTFNTEYVYYTRTSYDSKKIVRGASLSDVYYRSGLAKQYKDLSYPADFFDKDPRSNEYYVRELIKANRNMFPIYFYENPLPIENSRWMKTGLLKKLVPNDKYSKEELVRINEKLFPNFSFNNFRKDLGYSQYMISFLKETYYGSLTQLSRELIENGLYDEANKYLDSATVLFPDTTEAYVLLGNNYLLNKDCNRALDSYKKVYEIDKKEWKALEAVSTVYGECIGDKDKSEIYKKEANQLKSKLEEHLH